MTCLTKMLIYFFFVKITSYKLCFFRLNYDKTLKKKCNIVLKLQKLFIKFKNKNKLTVLQKRIPHSKIVNKINNISPKFVLIKLFFKVSNVKK